MDFLASLDAEIAAQETILSGHPAWIKLKALRATRDVYVSGLTGTQNRTVERRRSAPAAGKSSDAVSAVIDILAEHGRPLRTAQLLPLIEQRGISFAGNAPQNILSSLLSRSEDVVSQGGHVGWALKEWVSAGDPRADTFSSPADVQPEAQGREAGPGGGT
jgi:hypothetical protein